MSDTPETDAAKLQSVSAYNILRPNGWEFARRMERERDAAREALAEIYALVQRSAAWANPNDISGSRVAIADICEEGAK